MNVRRRAAGLLVVSLAMPTVVLLSSLIAHLSLESQKSEMPRVTELSKLTWMLDIEERVNHEDKPQRIAALKTLIAANYRDVAEDQTKMNSLYAAMVIPHQRRKWLHESLAAPPPTAEEAAAAQQLYEEITSGSNPISPAEMGFFSFNGLTFVATAAWMELIWVPSMLTAILFRGGALLWMFGLTLINRRGQRASRLRVLFRMFVGGIPALVVAYAFLQSPSFGGAVTVQSQLIMAAALVGIVVLMWLGRNRLLHDRIAGTYLAAR